MAAYAVRSPLASHELRPDTGTRNGSCGPIYHRSQRTDSDIIKRFMHWLCQFIDHWCIAVLYIGKLGRLVSLLRFTCRPYFDLKIGAWRWVTKHISSKSEARQVFKKWYFCSSNWCDLVKWKINSLVKIFQAFKASISLILELWNFHQVLLSVPITEAV